jgi:hypothetical protein
MRKYSQLSITKKESVWESTTRAHQFNGTCFYYFYYYDRRVSNPFFFSSFMSSGIHQIVRMQLIRLP